MAYLSKGPSSTQDTFQGQSLKDGELSNFFGDLSVDDIFRIAIVGPLDRYVIYKLGKRS